MNSSRTFGFSSNTANNSDGKSLILSLDLHKVYNSITANNKGQKHFYYFIYHQEGGKYLPTTNTEALPNEWEPPHNSRLGNAYIGDRRYGRVLLNNPSNIKLSHGGDTSLTKGILINKYAARFAHPVGQYGFDKNIVEKGEGIKTFYMVCEVFSKHCKDKNTDKLVLFDTSNPDHYPVELGYTDLKQKFHILSPTIGYESTGLSGTLNLKKVILTAYLKILGYLKRIGNSWQYGYTESDGTWIEHSNISQIVTNSKSSNTTPDYSNKYSGSTFSVIQTINTGYWGQFLSNPEKAFTRAYIM